MRFSLSLSSVLAMAAAVLAAEPLVVNTPTSAPQCGNTIGTWTGGTPPFTLAMNHDNGFKEGLVPGPGDHAGTWHTNLPAGTTVFFSVTDGAGVFGRSADFVVQPSADSSCL